MDVYFCTWRIEKKSQFARWTVDGVSRSLLILHVDNVSKKRVKWSEVGLINLSALEEIWIFTPTIYNIINYNWLCETILNCYLLSKSQNSDSDAVSSLRYLTLNGISNLQSFWLHFILNWEYNLIRKK